MNDKTNKLRTPLLTKFLSGFSVFILIGFVVSTIIVEARENNHNVLTLERIYKDNEFSLKRFGPTRWLEDGSGYTTLEESDPFPKAMDIIKYDPESGMRSILVSAGQLIPKGKQHPLLVSDYRWSADGKKLLIFTNSVRVWRYETRGDYWVLDLVSGELTQLGKGYVVKNNIYVEDLKTAGVVQLTHDGSSRIINGTFDWVYEEELDCRDGFRWSPDGRHIAYWQTDTDGIGTFYLINNIDSLYSQPIPLPYPKAGTTNSAVKVGVVSVTGGTGCRIKTESLLDMLNPCS